MAKIALNYPGANGAKYQRSLDAFALQQGKTPEEIMEPILRGIAQQVGLDANDDEMDQEAALAKAERKGNKAKADRETRAAEAARLVAESEARRKEAEAKAAETAAEAVKKTDPNPTTK